MFWKPNNPLLYASEKKPITEWARVFFFYYLNFILFFSPPNSVVYSPICQESKLIFEVIRTPFLDTLKQKTSDTDASHRRVNSTTPQRCRFGQYIPNKRHDAKGLSLTFSNFFVCLYGGIGIKTWVSIIAYHTEVDSF